jgi:dCTP diphosphatase
MASATGLTFERFQRQVGDYVGERGWHRYHKPKDLAISIAIESAELLELFQWRPDSLDGGRMNEDLRSRIGEELADVIIYCTCMANALDIDLSKALVDKIQKNRRKYPAGKVVKAKDWDEVRLIRAKSSDKNGDG